MPVVHSDAGKLASPEKLERIPALLSAYYTEYPDPKNPEQKVAATAAHRLPSHSMRNIFPPLPRLFATTAT